MNNVFLASILALFFYDVVLTLQIELKNPTIIQVATTADVFSRHAGCLVAGTTSENTQGIRACGELAKCIHRCSNIYLYLATNGSNSLWSL